MLAKLLKLNTINKKLLLPTLLMIAVLIGVLGTVLIIQQQRVLTSMMESKADSLTTILSTISSQPMINYDVFALQTFVKETIKDDEVGFAEYYDGQGKLLTGDVSKAPDDTSQMLVYERDIHDYGDKVIGKIRVGYKTDRLKQTLRRSIGILVGSLFVMLILLAFGQAFIVKSMSRPLKNAIQIAEHVAEGDLTSTIELTLTANQSEGRRLKCCFNR